MFETTNQIPIEPTPRPTKLGLLGTASRRPMPEVWASKGRCPYFFPTCEPWCCNIYRTMETPSLWPSHVGFGIPASGFGCKRKRPRFGISPRFYIV